MLIFVNGSISQVSVLLNLKFSKTDRKHIDPALTSKCEEMNTR
jgi:hypothetical protein